MSNAIKKTLLLVAVVAAAAASLIFVERPRHALAQTLDAANVSTSPVFEPGRHGMTPAEHIAMMAGAGNIHAGHAVDEFARATFQAAPATLKLPADDMGVVARLAGSPR